MYVYVQVCVCMHVYVYKYMYVCTNICVCIFTCNYDMFGNLEHIHVITISYLDCEI